MTILTTSDEHIGIVDHYIDLLGYQVPHDGSISWIALVGLISKILDDAKCLSPEESWDLFALSIQRLKERGFTPPIDRVLDALGNEL